MDKIAVIKKTARPIAGYLWFVFTNSPHPGPGLLPKSAVRRRVCDYSDRGYLDVGKKLPQTFRGGNFLATTAIVVRPPSTLHRDRRALNSCQQKRELGGRFFKSMNKADTAMLWILVGGTVSGVVTVLAALFIVYQNSGSRNLALAFSALVSTIVLFGIQLLFELQPGEPTYNQVSASYNIDREAPAIKQWSMPRVGMRAAGETGASNWLQELHPNCSRTTTKVIGRRST
jgi:hypothetical protein